jgi:hypothetical protein
VALVHSSPEELVPLPAGWETVSCAELEWAKMRNAAATETAVKKQQVRFNMRRENTRQILNASHFMTFL